MKLIARIISILLFLVYLLFVYQNFARFPMKDTQGGYLSLDLYFVGIQLGQPISMAILLGISFILGTIFYPFLRYIFTKDEISNDFYSDDY